MWDWASSLWDYTKAGAGYMVDNASNIGTLLAGGAALYSAFNKPKAPSLPAMPSMPSMPSFDSTATGLTQPPVTVGADYKSILAQADKVKAQVKLDTSKSVAEAQGSKRKRAMRADIKTDSSVWNSYAPISYKTLLGGN